MLQHNYTPIKHNRLKPLDLEKLYTETKKYGLFEMFKQCDLYNLTRAENNWQMTIQLQHSRLTLMMCAFNVFLNSCMSQSAARSGKMVTSRIKCAGRPYNTLHVIYSKRVRPWEIQGQTRRLLQMLMWRSVLWKSFRWPPRRKMNDDSDLSATSWKNRVDHRLRLCVVG